MRYVCNFPLSNALEQVHHVSEGGGLVIVFVVQQYNEFVPASASRPFALQLLKDFAGTCFPAIDRQLHERLFELLLRLLGRQHLNGLVQRDLRLRLLLVSLVLMSRALLACAHVHIEIQEVLALTLLVLLLLALRGLE